MTDSLALTAGIAAGGFLIDVDHAVDYVLFERQRDLRPSAFLRYYMEGHVQRVVLVLHSYELFALLGLLAWHLRRAGALGLPDGALVHIIVIFLENHTFDNLYGKFAGANGLDRPGARIPQVDRRGRLYTVVLRHHVDPPVHRMGFDLPPTGTRPANNLLPAFEFPPPGRAGEAEPPR